jgi:tartrate dehydrogenase/decarboxylase/D-malate dehydrogenase
MTTDHKFQVAVIAGDGIGREVIPAGMAAIEAVTRGTPATVSFTELPWGCEYYLKHHRMMDEDGFDRLAAFDAIYLGAIGAPGVADHVSVWELILPLRQRFDQYVSPRPMRLLPGLTSPLANRGARDIDMVCVRENSEGEYSGIGGRLHVGTPHEVAEQPGVFTRRGIERIVRYGFEVAAKRPRRMLASATKSNALQHSMVLWDEVAEEVSKSYPSVAYRKYHVDALAARMITHPDTVDVIVASNLFGDILTDLGAAISGSPASRPGRTSIPSGATLRCSNQSMALPRHRRKGHRESHWRHLGWCADARPPRPPRAPRPPSRRDRAVVAAGTIRTPDLGGKATTEQMTKAITDEIS